MPKSFCQSNGNLNSCVSNRDAKVKSCICLLASSFKGAVHVCDVLPMNSVYRNGHLAKNIGKGLGLNEKEFWIKKESSSLNESNKSILIIEGWFRFQA